jgi:hypothetical protein
MRFSAALAAAALSALLSSCGGGDDDGGDASVWHFRGINVVADAPVVQFYIDGTAVETADYGASTVYHPAHTGTQPIRLAVKNPSDLSSTDQGYTDIGTSEDFQFQGPTDYTLIATGTQANPRKFLITGTSSEAADDNKVNYQVINAAVDQGDVEVLITAPEAGITTAQSLGTLTLGSASTATDLTIPVASGADDDDTRSVNITLEVRSAGNTIYQSSAFNVGETHRLLFVVADNSAPTGSSPVKVLSIADSTGSAAGTTTVINDPDDIAELRLANLSPDTTGSIDLIEGSSAASVYANDIAFGQQSAYTPVSPGLINAIATPGNNNSAFLFVNNFTASQTRSYTLYAQDTMANIRGVLLTDDRRSVPSEARFRFLHASPSEGGGSVDIYVRQSGAGLDLNATTPPTATVSALGYRAASSAFSLKAGTYDVYFARAGAKTTILGPLPLVLVGGSVETLALADSTTSELTLLPVDDARP